MMVLGCIELICLKSIVKSKANAELHFHTYSSSVSKSNKTISTLWGTTLFLLIIDPMIILPPHYSFNLSPLRFS